jgi:hypothetical protein
VLRLDADLRTSGAVAESSPFEKRFGYSHLRKKARAASPSGVTIALHTAGGQEQMLRTVLGVSALGALLVTYWVHPMTAWIVLGSTFTLAVAFKVRQRDEAEGALQTIDE